MRSGGIVDSRAAGTMGPEYAFMGDQAHPRVRGPWQARASETRFRKRVSAITWVSKEADCFRTRTTGSSRGVADDSHDLPSGNGRNADPDNGVRSETPPRSQARNDHRRGADLSASKPSQPELANRRGRRPSLSADVPHRSTHATPDDPRNHGTCNLHFQYSS